MRLADAGGTGRLPSKPATGALKHHSAPLPAPKPKPSAARQVQRAATGRLGELGHLPWEKAKAVSKRVHHGIQSTQEKLGQASKSIKAGRTIYKGLSESQRFVGFIDRAHGHKVVRSASRAGTKALKAAETVTKGKLGKVVEHSAKAAGYGKAALSGQLVEHVVGQASKSATKKLIGSTDKAIARGAGRIAAREGATIGAKALGRFAPGANIAMAGYDIYRAGKTLRDPKASTWKKGMAVATAGLSVVAASNVPIVSQVAAGLSIATDLASNLNPKKAWGQAKSLGKKIFGGL